VFEDLGEGPHYAVPEDDVVFGDIFEAQFLRDVYVRDTTALMGGGNLAGNLAIKLGKWMGEQLSGEDIGLYSPALPPKPDARFALAQASFLPAADMPRAILVSDSCATATALVQGRERRSVGGRLLFAPLSVVAQEKWDELVASEDFARFPLPPDDRLPAGSVAELSSCFMVDARDIKKHVASRIASLNAPLSEELEMHWAAFAARLGPRAFGRNTLKLASVLSGGGEPGGEEQSAALALADVLDLAHFIEGKDLEDVSAAEESVRLSGGDAAQLTPPLVENIIEHLRELSDQAAAAAEGLSARV
jgi:hypothetical protein